MPEPVTIDARVLRLITTPERLRRARVAYRADGDVYADLLALTAVVLGAADGTRLAVRSPAADAWIMTDEAARRLGVTPHAVCRMLREGRLSGSKRRGVWLVNAAGVTRLETTC